MVQDLISRQQAIDAHYEYCNKHPDAGFPVWSLKILEDLSSAQPVAKDTNVPIKDCISRQAAIDEIEERKFANRTVIPVVSELNRLEGYVLRLPSAQPEPQWIPCGERLPDGAYPVIVTWKNTDPASYYQYILGKHYVGVAHYKNGKWYWYSSVTEDVLMEYGRYDSEEFDEAIECMAWMPLPEPYAERRTDEGD